MNILKINLVQFPQCARLQKLINLFRNFLSHTFLL